MLMMTSSVSSQSCYLTFWLCLLSYLYRQVLVSATLQPTCYWEYLNHEDSAGNDGPCAVVNSTSAPVSCCSSGDTCMGNNICYGLGGSHLHGSGYYLSGCTDISLSSSSCTTHCISNGYPDIVYNVMTGLWACCTVDDFNVNCSLPTNETFSALAPSSLTGTFVAHSSTVTSAATSSQASIPKSSTSSSTTSSTTITPSAASAAANQNPTSSPSALPSSTDPLSTGAKVGIAVAAGVAFLVLVGIAFAFFRRQRKADRISNGLALQNATLGLNKFGYGYAYGDLSGSPSYSQVPLNEALDSGIHELHQKPAPIELSATLNPAELGGWDNYRGGNYRIPGPVKKHDTYYHP